MLYLFQVASLDYLQLLVEKPPKRWRLTTIYIGNNFGGKNLIDSPRYISARFRLVLDIIPVVPVGCLLVLLPAPVVMTQEVCPVGVFPVAAQFRLLLLRLPDELSLQPLSCSACLQLRLPFCVCPPRVLPVFVGLCRRGRCGYLVFPGCYSLITPKTLNITRQ